MQLYLYGASGHGKVIADILSALGTPPQGFVDDDPAKQGKPLGRYPVVSLVSVPKAARFIVGIGDNAIRASKAAELERAGFQLATAVHPSAVVAPGAVVGAGSVVMAGAIINADAKVGRNVIVNTGATIDHDCILEDGCHVSPGAHLAGNVRVGVQAHVGIGAVAVPGISIGNHSVVGAGSVVIRNVPEGCTHVGNPAREIRGYKRVS